MTSRLLANCAGLLLCSLPLMARGDVFINEIHYDTPGTDVDETVEVVATGGENLAQYRIVLYNGSGGASYNDQPLSAGAEVICGSTVRIATINFTALGGQIQNGSPDGLALVGPGDTVVQFLSYEGVFTATNGPASGMLSTDIGVAEDNTGPVGQSLQLAGAGNAYAQFKWRGEADSTFEGCNNDQTFTAAVDLPPGIIATDPEEGATEVAVSATLAISFSEPVALADPWFTLSCDSIAQTAQTSGGPSAWVITPDAPLPFGASCSLTVLAAAVIDLDGEPDAMGQDFVLGFDTIEDLPPTLIASTPTNDATGFPANASLQLTFSEPVDLGPTWFQIVCSVSGTREVGDTTVSGDAAVYGIDPLLEFNEGESCTLQLDAAQITDRDGMADALVGPSTVAFGVGAPVVNQPPQVLSTVPMDGDDDFPAAADLMVLFSEPVNAQTGAFTLACAQSGSVSLVHASSGTSFSIDTGTALIAGEACTFTIVAKHVRDLEDALVPNDVVVVFSVRESGAGSYYDPVNTSSPGQLRCSLHQTIRGHTEYPYGWEQLEIADEDPLDSTRILDIYRNCSYAKVDSRVGNGGPASTCGPVSNVRYNREHVWPRSLGFNNTNLAAHNDLHMLHLSDELFNAHRGNKPFASCPQTSGCSEDRTIAYAGQGGGDGSYPGLSNWYTASTDGSQGSYEVWTKLRGNMARAIFYMAIRYEGGDNLPDLELTDNRNLIVGRQPSDPIAHMGLLTTLLQWHLDDPVDDRELDRNQVIFNFQGNRNPFVDRPEWATLALFQSTTPPVCELAGEDEIFANGFEEAVAP